MISIIHIEGYLCSDVQNEDRCDCNDDAEKDPTTFVKL